MEELSHKIKKITKLHVMGYGSFVRIVVRSWNFFSDKLYQLDKYATLASI